MIYVVFGVLGVLVVHLCDPAAIRKLPLVKPVVWILGVGLTGYAAIMACLWPDKLTLPSWTNWLGWSLLAISFLLVVYSLFVSLPFHKTYVATGVGDKLITNGFYALTRHPGVLWTVLLVIALILTSRSRLVLVAAPLFILLDVGVVAIQDRFYFGRMFTGYERYRKETPMLIPNRNSLKAFINSFRSASQPAHVQGGDNDIEPI